MKISCSVIHDDCRVGSIYNLYGKLKTSEEVLAPIDEYLVWSITVTEDMTDTEIQFALDAFLKDFETDLYDFGLQIIDNCGQYSNFATDSTTARTCVANISSLTYIEKLETIQLNLDGTTADGHLEVIATLGNESIPVVPRFPNTNTNVIVLPEGESIKGDGIIITLDRYENEKGPCSTFSFSTSNRDVSAAQTTQTLFSIPSKVDVKSCNGVISYSELYKDPLLNVSLDSTTGVVTIPPSESTNMGYMYLAQALCTYNGVTSVIAIIRMIIRFDRKSRTGKK